MDALGLIVAVIVPPAAVQDCAGAKRVLGPLRHRVARLRGIVAAAINTGGIAAWGPDLRRRTRHRLEMKTKRLGAQGFAVIPWRWRVERTVA